MHGLPAQKFLVRRRRMLALGVALSASLMTAACSASSTESTADPVPTDVTTTQATTATQPPATAAPTSVPATTTTIVPGSPEDEAAIKAVIDRYYAAYEAAGDPPNPDHPDLLAVEKGTALAGTQRVIVSIRDKNQVSRRPGRGAFPHEVSGYQINGNIATLFECLVDDGVSYNVDGSVADEQVSSFKYKVGLERGGPLGWMIVARDTIAKTKGRWLCPGL